MRLNIGEAITGKLESAKKGDVLRIRLDEKIAESRSDDLIPALITVHPRHRVVAFGEICEPVHQLDLLVHRKSQRE